MNTRFVGISLAVMGASAQAASMHRDLRRSRKGREQCGENCYKCEMGDETAHQSHTNVSRFATRELQRSVAITIVQGGRRCPPLHELCSPATPGGPMRNLYCIKTYRPPLVNSTTRHMTTKVKS